MDTIAGIEWVKKYRLDGFKKSELYVEYKLAKKMAEAQVNLCIVITSIYKKL